MTLLVHEDYCKLVVVVAVGVVDEPTRGDSDEFARDCADGAELSWAG